MTKPLAIACIGEVMIELIAGQGNTAELNVAGDTYNTAAYLVRSLKGTDARVSYVTTLGKDTFSERIMHHMQACGIDGSQVARHPTRVPGLYAIETDASGERSFTYWRSSAAARTMFGEDGRDPDAVLAAFDTILLTGITLAILPQESRDRLIDAIERFRAQGGTVAFDSNYRAHLWNDPALARTETARMWRQTDIALPSIDDEMALFGDTDEAALLARFRDYGIARGALKRGTQGPRDLGPGGTVLPVTPVAKVVDTTAAGDSFNAAYLATVLRDGDPVAAMQAGHDLASRVIGKRGAIVETDS